MTSINNNVEWQEFVPAWRKFISTPMTYPDCRLFFGDQGSGKSISTVACMADDIVIYTNRLLNPETGEVIKANALTDIEIKYLKSPVSIGGMGIKDDLYYPIRYKYMRIFTDDGKKSKIVQIPKTWVILSPVKIFANRTIYGFRYAPFDLEVFIKKINTDLMTNSWVILSESVLISKKDTMSYLGRFMEWFGAECRKRHNRMAVDMQYKTQLAPVFHLFATTRVDCTYDTDTTIVSLDVNTNSPVMNSTDYISKFYRKFYKTDELMKIPEYRQKRALETITGEKQ